MFGYSWWTLNSAMLNRNCDAAAKSCLEESSLNLQVKVEPDASQPEAIVGKPWIDTVSASAAESNNSSDSPDDTSNKETLPEPSTSSPISTVISPVPRSTPMLLHNTQSLIPGAPTSSQNIMDQARRMVGPRSNPPRYMHNAHKHSWAQRQKEVKKILKQRTQEWKEKQSLYQLMRGAASSHKSLLGYRKQDPVLFARGKHPTGTDVIPRTAFNWYPGFMAPTEVPHIRSYPLPTYPIMTEFDPKFIPNSAPLLKRRYSNETSSAGEGKSSSEGLTALGHHDPLIKEVVSLASNKSPNVEDGNSAGHRRSKRARKSIDEPSPAERRESIDSGNSETDGDNLSSGKYISDFAETFQNTPEDHQVAHINGLLSLPSSRETRYGITYGELKRRCGAPEYLTRVDLVAYVRHSKSSGRSLLDKYKIVSANRASRPTIMSKMCENEARVLGDGILRMNMNYFPDKMLAEVATESLRDGVEKDEEDGNKQEKMKSKIEEKMKNIETTRSMLKEVFDLLQSEKDQEEMHRFELASHTFGTVNLKNHLTLFDRFFQEYQTALMASIDKSDSASE
ncbi:uncharacterized protein LOC114518954 isoform X2 [Dendronephthya gigantea]|uniref:uncharacterized protein LOC114518954 isoform X2 n=1 Tax=Dendronephthya gigantea TaxID=151771 RepID=UPI00106C0475|nr:uncharacterized protein LOC114518954 isoform X2 [Dendronephthya gigantea]XP_028394804.1 uncharacterized protein LOC114518954 isoform X2 [Dendronephthya gigantea]